jgi:hypothetical protein
MRVVVVIEEEVEPPPLAHEWLLYALLWMAIRDRWIAEYQAGLCEKAEADNRKRASGATAAKIYGKTVIE